MGGTAAPPAAPEAGLHAVPAPGRALGAALRYAWPALAGYLAVRAVGLVTLAWWAHVRGVPVVRLLATRSDAAWYLGIARHGYDGGQGQSDLAFFPLYPALTAAVARVAGWGSHPQLVVAWTAGLLAAWGLFAVGAAVGGRWAGVALAVLWGVEPHAVVESMAYTEGLFTALAAWCLLALLRRRWLAAGLLCLLAGLARPTALALVPVVMLDAALALRRPGTAVDPAAVVDPGARAAPSGRWRPAACLVLAPLGAAGYLAWVAQRTGRPDGWQHVQRAGWHSTWDWGADAARQAGRILTSTSQPLPYYVVTAVVVVAVLLALLGLADRQPWQLSGFAVLVLALTVGSSGYYHAKARFLLVAFPLLLPVARSLARAPAVKAVATLALLTATSAYVGGHLLLVWPWSP